MAGDRPAVGLPACELSCGLSLVAWPLPRAGISLKTQELYVIVFIARYLDLFWNFLSIYNWVMKVIFITASLSIVYIMRFGMPHRETYNKEDDAFPTQYILVPALLLLPRRTASSSWQGREQVVPGASPFSRSINATVPGAADGTGAYSI